MLKDIFRKLIQTVPSLKKLSIAGDEICNCRKRSQKRKQLVILYRLDLLNFFEGLAMNDIVVAGKAHPISREIACVD